MKTISELKDNLVPLAYNPNLMQMAVLNSLQDVGNGESIEIVDPGNPLIFMIDNAVALASCSIEHNESALRKRYPIMATSMEDLYAHMSDRDYLDMFAQPAPATWTLLIGRDELKHYAVPRDSMGVRKLVIPRDTSFTVGGYTYTMQYGIELRQMPHGGVTVVYDTDIMSPIRELDTNTLDWKIIDIPYGGTAVSMLVINVPVLQYKIDSYNENIIAGTTFKRTYKFDDKFFTARVWLRNQKGTWDEINTTYAQHVINPDVPTAQILVREHDVIVQIPDIYIRSSLARGDVRIDIYSTKGKIDVDLGQFATESFQFKTRDIGNEVNSMFYTPLNTFSNFAATSTTVCTGGRPSLSFQAMKDRLIDNAATGRKIPISEKQLESTLDDRGFKLSKSIDYVTERIYMASTEMPKSTIPTVSTPVGNINGILETSLSELVKLKSVRDNGNRITITPDTLYLEQHGMVSIDLGGGIENYKSLSPNLLISKLNDGNYLYSPLHYVIDNNSEILTMRAYYLDNAHITSKQFVETNSTLMLDVNTDTFVLETTNYGYRILVTTRSGDTYKNIPDKKIRAQMSFTPRGYTDAYAYLNGEMIGRTDKDERIFEFKVMTNLDIDMNHDIIINNFTIAGNTSSPTPLKLDCEMNIIYTVTGYTTPEFKHSNIDKVLNTSDREEKGITHEKLNVTLGQSLDRIWTNARTIVDSIDYARYPEDVFATWSSDIIDTDDNDAPKYSIVEVDGKPTVQFVYKHRKGDQILKDGKPILLHKKGTVMEDNGKPVIKNPRSIGWRLELFLFDAKYIFSNTKATKDYMNMVVKALLSYLTIDINEVDNMLLEKTSLYLYPRSTIGQVNVLLADGTISSIDAAQKFKMSYYLTSAGRQNDDLLKTIARVSRQVILESLESRTVSVSAIVKAVRDRLGTEIVDVEMSSIGASEESLYTVVDDSDKLTLGKKVAINPDGTIGIKDDISITYSRHEVKS